MSSQTSPVEVVTELLKKKDVPAEQLETSLNGIEEKDRQKFAEDFKKKFDSLEETEKQLINENLRSLSIEKVQNQLNAMRRVTETLAPKTTEKPAQLPQSKAVEKAPVTQTKPETKKGGDSWLPHTWNPHEWTAKEIATASAVSLGGIGLVVLARKLWNLVRGKKKEPNTETKKGLFGNLLYWIPGVGLAIVGLVAAHEMLKKFDGYAKLFDGVDKKVNESLTWMKNQITHPISGAEWTKWDLTEEEWGKAQEICRRTPEKDRRVGLEKIYNARHREARFEDFLKAMNERHQDKLEDGVHYARASVAIRNYEDNIASAVSEVERWVKDHEAAVLAGVLVSTVVVGQLAVLRKILSAGTTALVTAKNLAKAMLEWGIDHPIISLLGLAGTIATLRTLKDSVWLPRNLEEFSKVCSNEGKAALNAVGDEPRIVTSVASEVRKMGLIDGSYVDWIKTKLSEMWNFLTNKVPEKLTTTPEKSAEDNIKRGIESLRVYLAQRAKPGNNTNQEMQDGEILQYDEALKCLKEYEETYIREHSGTVVTGTKSGELLKKLEAVLSKFPKSPVSLETKDGIVRWKDPSMPEGFDLSVDPAIIDTQRIHALSDQMMQSEPYYEHVYTRAKEQFEILQGEAMKRGKHIAKNGTVAMLLGDLLVCVDVVDGIPHYFKTQKDASWGEIMKLVHGEKTDFVCNFTDGAVACTMFALSKECFARIKRFMVGGGPTNRIRHAVRSATPLVSMVQDIRDVGHVFDELQIFKKFPLLKARELSRVCGKSRIRAQWVSIVQTSDDFTELEKIGKEIGAKFDKDIKIYREHILDAMKKNVEKYGTTHTFRDSLQDFVRYRWGKLIRGTPYSWKGLMKDLRFTFADIEHLNVERLLSDGTATAKELFEAGVTPERLLRSGVTPEELVAAGVDPADIPSLTPNPPAGSPDPSPDPTPRDPSPANEPPKPASDEPPQPEPTSPEPPPPEPKTPPADPVTPKPTATPNPEEVPPTEPPASGKDTAPPKPAEPSPAQASQPQPTGPKENPLSPNPVKTEPVTEPPNPSPNARPAVEVFPPLADACNQALKSNVLDVVDSQGKCRYLIGKSSVSVLALDGTWEMMIDGAQVKPVKGNPPLDAPQRAATILGQLGKVSPLVLEAKEGVKIKLRLASVPSGEPQTLDPAFPTQGEVDTNNAKRDVDPKGPKEGLNGKPKEGLNGKPRKDPRFSPEPPRPPAGSGGRIGPRAPEIEVPRELPKL